MTGSQEPKKSQIIITFTNRDSIQFDIHAQECVPPQLLIAAHFLRTMAERQITSQLNYRDMMEARKERDLVTLQRELGKKP